MTRSLPLSMLPLAFAVGFGAGTAAHAAHDPAAVAALKEVQNYYASAPVCERVGVQVKLPPAAGGGLPRISRASYTIRFRAVPQSGLSPLVTLELGQYQIDATPNRVTVAHFRDPTTFFQQGIDGEVTSRTLAGVVPPLPLPSLDLAQAVANADTAGICADLWPYANAIEWTTLETDPRAPARRTLRGRFPQGSVSLLLAGTRMRVLTIERDDPRISITMSFSPIAGCDPDKPLIDTIKRSSVASLLDLKPRGGAIRVGDALPAVEFSPAGGGQWSLPDLLDSPPEAVIVGVPPAEHAVLVLTRVSAPGAIPPLPRMDFDRLGSHLRSTRSAAFTPRAAGTPSADQAEQPPRFGYARVLVFNNPDPALVIEALNQAGRQWGMRSVLFAATSATSIDLVAPGADAVVLIIDSQSVVRAVIPIDSGSATEQVADQIAGALFEIGAPRGMAAFAPPAPPGSAPSEPKP